MITTIVLAAVLHLRVADCHLTSTTGPVEIPTGIELFVDLLNAGETRNGTVVLTGGDPGDQTRILTNGTVSGLDSQSESRQVTAKYVVPNLFVGGEGDSYSLSLVVPATERSAFPATLKSGHDPAAAYQYICKGFP